MSFNVETVWKYQTKKPEKPSHRMENETQESRDPQGKNWTWTI